MVTRARAPARRPQGRARGRGPVHGPGRSREARGRRPCFARLLRVEPARLGLAHALGARRLRELQDVQHRGPRAGHRHRPDELLPAPRRSARGSAALLVPGAAGHRCRPPRGRRPLARGGRLGPGGDPWPHDEPQHRGAPRRPRDRARARTGLGLGRPSGRGPHDRPAGERPARGQARARAAGADRRLVHLRGPRHGHEVELPVLQPGPPRLGAPGVRARRAQGGAGAAPPAGPERLRQLERGRPVGGAGARRARRLRLRGTGRGRRDAERLAAGACRAQ